MTKSASLMGVALMVFGIAATAVAASAVAADMPQFAGSRASTASSCAHHRHKAAHKASRHRSHRPRKSAHS